MCNYFQEHSICTFFFFSLEFFCVFVRVCVVPTLCLICLFNSYHPRADLPELNAAVYLDTHRWRRYAYNIVHFEPVPRRLTFILTRRHHAAPARRGHYHVILPACPSAPRRRLGRNTRHRRLFVRRQHHRAVLLLQGASAVLFRDIPRYLSFLSSKRYPYFLFVVNRLFANTHRRFLIVLFLCVCMGVDSVIYFS